VSYSKRFASPGYVTRGAGGGSVLPHRLWLLAIYPESRGKNGARRHRFEVAALLPDLQGEAARIATGKQSVIRLLTFIRAFIHGLSIEPGLTYMFATNPSYPKGN